MNDATDAMPLPRDAASPAPKARDLNISQLIAETLRDTMRSGPDVLILGEDVAVGGGTFGATRGLLREFGEQRVRDTPISEMAFTGLGVGLAMSGLRPVVEIMFADFIGVCLEQIVNAAAKNHYMSGGQFKVPMTIRTAGGCIGVAAQHSQCLWGTLAHFPGVRVVAPSSPADYRQMLIDAIDCDDPVVFIEHKDAYLRKISTFPFGADLSAAVPAGLTTAAIVRTGSDLTIATLSTMVERAWEAADLLAGHGVSVELVDLRTVSPLDHRTVTESVARTGRLLVVDEDYRSFGMSGELVARVYEELGPSGLSAVKRLAVPDVPIPAALSLEDQVIPRTNHIVDAVKALVGP